MTRAIASLYLAFAAGVASEKHAFGASAPCDPTEEWQRMIRAKGGRESLGRVNSLVVTSDFVWGLGLGRSRGRSIDLYRFPADLWSWFESGSRNLGGTVGKTNLATGDSSSQYIDTNSPADTLNVGTAPWQRIQIVLLETPWMQPKATGCSKDDRGVVVKTEFRGLELAFTSPGETYLPVRVELSKESAIASFELGKYALSGGLQMPHEIVVNSRLHGSGTKESVRYEINPMFDPKVFDGPLRRDLGPEQWRRRP
jgi:hypothetical protein